VVAILTVVTIMIDLRQHWQQHSGVCSTVNCDPMYYTVYFIIIIFPLKKIIIILILLLLLLLIIIIMKIKQTAKTTTKPCYPLHQNRSTPHYIASETIVQ